MPQYAFDVTLLTVARVTASNEDVAREMLSACDSFELNHTGIPGIVFTEASVELPVELFEIDGKEPK